jgi:hypothetical protein
MTQEAPCQPISHLRHVALSASLDMTCTHTNCAIVLFHPGKGITYINTFPNTRQAVAKAS